jgi:glutamate dehydrogenase
MASNASTATTVATKSTSAKSAKEIRKTQTGLFEELLFARAPEEDLAEYDAGALAATARIAETALARFKPGEPVIDVSNSDLIKRNGRPVTVITLINDNMPFLLDSVLGEIGERTSSIYLVMHPVMDVRMDGSVNVVLGFAGPEKPAKGVVRVTLERSIPRRTKS